ncbi:NUDIX domain-containing protein [Nocardia camponoti]|uniref:DNA mismatch repair protein MutT n=1 Tax=Nocardia camponoti TaxID=1616106 RepID=A0A917VD33_9NOCA|nr:NUDIX domain-containing protein [Nocardia camponoti]GGK64235.1 DNA mismatch repair protein MutT [Nocardia camponoti]
MTKIFSAGIVVFRRGDDGLEVLLGHMGGPFWARKDEAAWSIPKGEYLPDEEQPQAAAAREFVEELGLAVPEGEWLALGDVVYGRGKTLTAWAVEGDPDPSTIVPGTFEMEWPPRSGRVAVFPEIDRAAFFDIATATEKLVKGQRPLLARLAEELN